MSRLQPPHAGCHMGSNTTVATQLQPEAWENALRIHPDRAFGRVVVECLVKVSELVLTTRRHSNLHYATCSRPSTTQR